MYAIIEKNKLKISVADLNPWRASKKLEICFSAN